MNFTENTLLALRKLYRQHNMSVPISASVSAPLATNPPCSISPKKSSKNQNKVVNISDISTFFNSSTRDENDKINKIRENILEIAYNPPEEYLVNEEYGKSWLILQNALKDIIKKLAENTGIPHYTNVKISLKGGRNFNYDAEVMYFNGLVYLATRNIEFKYGAKKINNLPQFLSLQAKLKLCHVTYDKFWYDNYLDQYLACDSGITLPKPSQEDYLRCVLSTQYSVNPFFSQLKERELQYKNQKDEVVNKSITDYLTTYGHLINIDLFSEKVKSTQINKYYLLWSDNKFYLDNLPEKYMSGITFHSIHNGNTILLKSNNIIYKLLLRWRNHKGILNPAWQISLKITDTIE